MNYFHAKEVLPGTFLIRSHGSTSCLLDGTTEGLVIDPGDSYGNLREFVENLIGKRVHLVMNTNGHLTVI